MSFGVVFYIKYYREHKRKKEYKIREQRRSYAIVSVPTWCGSQFSFDNTTKISPITTHTNSR